MSIAEQLENLPSVRGLRAKGIVIDETSVHAARDASIDLCVISGCFVRADHDFSGDVAMKRCEWKVSVAAIDPDGEWPEDFLADAARAAETALL